METYGKTYGECILVSWKMEAYGKTEKKGTWRSETTCHAQWYLWRIPYQILWWDLSTDICGSSPKHLSFDGLSSLSPDPGPRLDATMEHWANSKKKSKDPDGEIGQTCDSSPSHPMQRIGMLRLKESPKTLVVAAPRNSKAVSLQCQAAVTQPNFHHRTFSRSSSVAGESSA